jgi:hypothetical protein
METSFMVDRAALVLRWVAAEPVGPPLSLPALLCDLVCSGAIHLLGRYRQVRPGVGAWEAAPGLAFQLAMDAVAHLVVTRDCRAGW